MQIRIDTLHSNILEIGQIEIYTRLPFGNEPINITCQKINCIEDGALTAEVNSNLATEVGQCVAYAGNWSSTIKCATQKFTYTLFRNDMSGVYDISCRLIGGSMEYVNYRIIKLCKRLLEKGSKAYRILELHLIYNDFCRGVVIRANLGRDEVFSQ